MAQSLILIVEDDKDLRDLMTIALNGAGYRTITAATGEAALDLYHAQAPNLVVLDVNLGPKSIDGFEVCRRIRRHSDTPIMFLTTQSDEIDQLIGLTSGADNYVAKPISPRLLLAHVTALLRRAETEQRVAEPSQLELDGVDIDLEARTVRVGGQNVDLTKIQFDLLAALAENPKRVLTREQLVERVWGDWYGDDHHLDVHLSRLRQRITEAGGPRVGHSVRGVGFRFSQ